MADPLPPHVTRPLLSLVTDQAVDADYRVAAQRAPGEGRRRSRVPALAAVAVLGLLLATAGVESAQGRGARESDRASLVAEAQSRRQVLADQQQRLRELRESNLADAGALTTATESERTLDARNTRLGARTGFTPVSGPGIRVELDAPPGGDPADDMTLLLDGLWNAGAEAISLNGRRITTLTRVASTGPAVSIDGRSLDPPYTLLAIGDPATLPARFAESSSGAAFSALAGALLFDFEISTAQDLQLPAARLPAADSLPDPLTDPLPDPSTERGDP